MTTNPTDGVLSEACEAFLSDCSLYSQAVPRSHGALADIYDCDGDFLFAVSTGIGVVDLQAIYRYGNRQYERGVNAGRETIAAALRDLIGAERVL